MKLVARIKYNYCSRELYHSVLSRVASAPSHLIKKLPGFPGDISCFPGHFPGQFFDFPGFPGHM